MVELISRLFGVLMLIGIIGGDVCMWVFGLGHGVPIGAAIAIQYISLAFLLIVAMAMLLYR